MRSTRTTFSPLPAGAHSDWSCFPKARSYAKEFDSRDGAVRPTTRGARKGTRATDKAGGRYACISRVSPVHQQTQVSSLTFERGEGRLSDDDEHHEMGGHNCIASGGVVPRGEQPGIGSYRRLFLGRPAGQTSNPCRKVFMGGGFRSDRCAFQSDRTDCPLWKRHTVAERVGSCNILDGCTRTQVRT